MEHQLLALLLSLIEANKAHIDNNRKYLYRYIQDQRHELNKIMELVHQKKKITDQVITLLEGADTFNTIINHELFEKVKEEMKELHEAAMDYFMHCYRVQFSTSEDDVNMPISDDNTENDLQHAVDKEVEAVKSRIQYLRDMLSQLE